VLGKRMEDHLRIAVCYWHSFNWPGSDVFGAGTFDRPWLEAGAGPDGGRPAKMDAAFEFLAKLGAPFFCFHDRDVAPEGDTFAESSATSTGWSTSPPSTWSAPAVQLLWGTANLFSHPRYAAGAATNPDPEVFAYAAAQVKRRARGDPPAGRRQLRAVGRPRGLRDAAQHRHAAARPTSSPAS
jgi:xylose isomerase